MVERTIIVPDKDNAGLSLLRERHAIEKTLLEVTGGYTAEQVRGAWKGDDGKVYRDRSTRYTVVADEEQDDDLAAWLPVWAASLRQEALFTSKRSVEVDFVTANTDAESLAYYERMGAA